MTIASTRPARAMIGPSTVHVVVLLIGDPCTAPIPCRVNRIPNKTNAIPATSAVLRMTED